MATADMPTTAFGAPVGDPRQSAALLRALASRAGLDLLECPDVDLVASVIAADLWSRVFGASDLARAGSFGDEAQESASRILARAAGYGDDCETPLGAIGDACAPALTMLEDYRAWAARHLGDEGWRDALRLAGADLVAGGGLIASAGAVLQVASGE